MNPIIYIAIQLIQLGFIIYLAFYKEYVKRKGSNLADKEDIADITKQIETVKKDFTSENEILKGNLQFVINNQLQNSNEERNAIIFFFDSYTKWLTVGLTDLNLTLYGINNIEDIFEKERQLNDFFIQAQITRSRITLLIENNDLIRLSHELLLNTLKYHHWAKFLLVELRINLQSNKHAFESLMQLLSAMPDSREIEKTRTAIQELEIKRNEIIKISYGENSERNTLFENVGVVQRQFTDTAKGYLKQKTIG